MKNSRIKKYGKIVLPHKSHDHTIWGKKKTTTKNNNNKTPKNPSQNYFYGGYFSPKLSEF